MCISVCCIAPFGFNKGGQFQYSLNVIDQQLSILQERLQSNAPDILGLTCSLNPIRVSEVEVDVTMSFPNIPWSLRTDTPSHFNEICIEITPTWSTANNISFYHLGLWGGYPAGRRTIYSWDVDKKVTFPNTIATPTGNSDRTGDCGDPWK
jgi:hypothetical protein